MTAILNSQPSLRGTKQSTLHYIRGALFLLLGFIFVADSYAWRSTTIAQDIVKVQAVSAVDFLNSLGAVSSVSRRGETVEGSIECMRYTGLRWIRGGYEDHAPIEDFIRLHRETGTKICYGFLSGKSDLERLLNDARQLAEAGALLSVEGLNEPNNWGIIYQDESGGRNGSWLPVARLQRDLYSSVKNDPVLKKYPVWMLSEGGAQTDNTGLQFLTIPENANTLMPAGTKYADYACCHNYICHPSWYGLHDNQTWLSSLPCKECPVDGLYGNYGLTWLKKFAGYSEKELETLPRVTTETGYAISEKEGVTEEIQARLYLNLYLSQFKQGWKHTAVYLLKGRVNEPDHEKFAFYTLDYKPKQAAHYMHNFTTILADQKPAKSQGWLAYDIPDRTVTTHDLLLQKSDGCYMLVIWGERFGSGGADKITVRFGGKIKQVDVYDPTIGTLSLNKHQNINFLELEVSDHPVILEIRL